MSRRGTARALTARVLAAAGLLAALAGCHMTPLASAHGPAPGGLAGPARGTGPAAGLPFDVSSLLDPSGKFLGVEAPRAPQTLAPVRRFAAAIGRHPNLIGQYAAWNKPFYPSGVINAWHYGALSYLAWEPYQTSVQAIAGGASDAYISRFARAVRGLGLPIVLSFGHEMNGNWYPWGTTAASPASFVAAWRHIHDLFVQAGASNVIWMWNPNIINPVPQVKLRPYYPGDAYVDWVGVTGYFPTTGPDTYGTLYLPTISEVRRFTSKPLIIAETSVETGPDEVASVHHLVAAVARHRDMLGFIWFDFNKNGVDWRAESRPILRAALARALSPVPLAGVTRH
ncbi:MAG: glycoside hydrolase family 26 protein [Gemmatimonadota bacterium]